MEPCLPAAIVLVTGVVIGMRSRAWAILPPACAMTVAALFAPVAGIPAGALPRIGLAIVVLVVLEGGFLLGAGWRVRRRGAPAAL